MLEVRKIKLVLRLGAAQTFENKFSLFLKDKNLFILQKP